MDSSKKRDRSTKTRPQSAGELVEALTSGTLDGRTRVAQQIVQAREVVTAEPDAAARGLIVDGVAVWGVVQAQCLAEISREKSLLEQGQLVPILEVLQAVQGNILKLTAALRGIDEKAGRSKSDKGGKAQIDITTLLEVTP